MLNKRGGESTVAGGTAMSVSQSDSTVFVVGTESGRVYKCAISSKLFYFIAVLCLLLCWFDDKINLQYQFTKQ